MTEYIVITEQVVERTHAVEADSPAAAIELVKSDPDGTREGDDESDVYDGSVFVTGVQELDDSPSGVASVQYFGSPFQLVSQGVSA